jgi:hypothetical protein
MVAFRYRFPVSRVGTPPRERSGSLSGADPGRPARVSSGTRVGTAPAVTTLTLQRIAQGVTGRVHGPLRVAVPFVVDEVDEATRQWTWSVFAGPVRLQLRHWVSPGPDGGATTGLRVHGAAPLVAGYAPLALIALQGLVRA